MKRITKILFVSLLLLLVSACIVSCSSNDAYKKINKEGYNVSVKFDIGKGMFEGRSELVLVDVFNLDNEKTGADGQKEISLLSPDSEKRGGEALKYTYNGHYFVGWYAERTLRQDDAGNFLDEYGNICKEEEASYTYSKKWDFGSNKLTVDPDKKYSAEEPVLTLYAAWVPFTQFEIYAENAEGIFEPLNIDGKGHVLSSSLEIPQWSKSTGKLSNSNFPTVEGKTFDSAYFDEACENPITESEILGNIDYEKGILKSTSIKVYTKWLEGTWYKIYNAQALARINDTGANYIICDDLDFKSVNWSNTKFAKEGFFGQLLSEEGSTYKLSGITSSNNKESDGGIFRILGDNAQIKNVIFENITFKVEEVPPKKAITFGLLAGTASDSAMLENVTFEGENTIIINPACLAQSMRYIGLIFGQGDSMDIDMTSIDCKLSAESATYTLDVNKTTGHVDVMVANP